MIVDTMACCKTHTGLTVVTQELESSFRYAPYASLHCDMGFS